MQKEILQAFQEVLNRAEILRTHRDMPMHLASYILEFITTGQNAELLQLANASLSEVQDIELFRAGYQELKDECNRLSLENTLLKSKTTIS